MIEDTILAEGIVSHPQISSGMPTVARGRIRTDVLRGRFVAGETIGELAEDYHLTILEVQDALRYELRIRLSKRQGGLKPTRVD